MSQTTKQRFIQISAVFLIILGFLLSVSSFYKHVTIQYNDRVLHVNTFAFHVAGVLKQEKIPVEIPDIVSPPPQSLLLDNDTITIQSIMPLIIQKRNTKIPILTYNRIVGNILTELNIPIYPGDSLLYNNKKISADFRLNYKRTPQVITILPSTEINVYDEDKYLHFITTKDTLASALKEQDISIRQDDFISPAPETILNGGIINVYISRAKSVNILYKSQTYQVMSPTKTVGDALAQTGFSLQGMDFCTPQETSAITENITIHLHRVDERITLEQETEPFLTQYTPLNDSEIDTLIVVQSGAYGVKVKRIREIYLDEELADRQTENEWTAKEPEPRILGYGTKINIRTLNTPDGPIRYWRAIKAYASSYSPCRSGVPNKCYPNTSSGKPVQKGVIAVTLSWYHYMKGMAVYIPGYGFATIEDVGAGLPNQNWVDLGYSDEDWVGWGQYVTIYFLAPPPDPQYIMWILD